MLFKTLIANLCLLSWPTVHSLTCQEPLHESVSKHTDYVPFFKEFDEYVNGILQDFFTPGLAIAIVHGNSTFTRGYGLADIESNEPVTPRTLFFTGSTTKSFTASIASQLVYSNASQYSKIQWDSRLADLIRDDFVLQDGWVTSHITLSDALSHRTGMPRHDFSWLNSELSVRDIVRGMRYLPLHHELRWTWEYCNLMFIAVGHALETVTRQTLGKLFKDRLWTILGMDETFADIKDALAYSDETEGIEMSKGYIYDTKSGRYIAQPYSSLPPLDGAGSLISNVQDYAFWLRAFLHPDNASSPITAQTVKDLTAPHMLIPQGPFSSLMLTNARTYGLGLQTGMYRGNSLISHGGSISGWMMEMAWLPDSDWGVVVMQNAASFASSVILWKLLDQFLTTPKSEEHDVAKAAKTLEQQAKTRLANAKALLYPDASKHAFVPPVLPLNAYVGVYSHPAYHGLNLSLPIETGVSETPFSLHASPAQKNFLNMTATFTHVNGEYWYARLKTGPGVWITDEIMKASFELGVDGRVRRLGLQAEPAMDQLAWFDKVI